MSNTPLPPTPEDEAFSAIENASKRKQTAPVEPWLWLPEGEYTQSQLRALVESFEIMKKERSALGGGH
jgi:hypothetical protein